MQDSRGISRTNKSAMVGLVALRLYHLLLLPAPLPHDFLMAAFRWIFSGGKSTDAKWMTADVFP